jgi:carboxylesterase
MLHQEKNASFFLGPEESNTACLLIHGFNSTLLEMRGLEEALASAGIYVYALAVAGHTGNPQDFLNTGHKEWIASAEAGLAQLARYPFVFVAGSSMGGALALLLASSHPDRITGVVIMSALTRVSPNTWQRHLLPLLPLARHFVKWVYPLSSYNFDDHAVQEEILDHARLRDPSLTIDFSDPQTVATIRSTMRLPVHAIEELVLLTRIERKQLSTVRSPLLIIHSKRDQMAPPALADELYSLTPAASPKSLHWLKCSHHVITIGPEREEVYRVVISFIKKSRETSS